MPIRVELLRSGDAAWEEWLSGVPRDIHHTPGYHAYAQASGEGEPFLIVVGDRRRGLAWPYLLRPISGVQGGSEQGLSDVTSVYGYPGPLAWGCAPGDPFLAVAWSEVQAAWREQGAVSAFTRFHPLLGNASLLAGIPWPRDDASGWEPVVAVGETVSIDCSLSDDAARKDYAGNLRRQIDAAHRAGLSTSHDEDWSDLGAFARLYRETMVRNAAADYYLFGFDDLERLRTALHGHLHLLVTRLDDTVAAAGLFTEFEGIIQVHLVATNEALISRSPFKVLVDDARRWARERGAAVLHLGGGRGGRDDGLFMFKSRFSPRRHVFCLGRWILDQAAYRGLLAARLSGVPGGALLDASYFPAYRAPFVDSPGAGDA